MAERECLMLYTLDITAIAKRVVPGWFRREPNLAFIRVLTRGLAVLQDDFASFRDVVRDQYRYNGLVHSLERMLNDHFDAIERRIYITVENQVPGYYHVEDGGPAFVHHLPLGTLSGYYHLNLSSFPTNYLYEFLVHVPASLTFQPVALFNLLDLYRFAGRRPAIVRENNDGDTVQLILHPMHNPPANWLVYTTPDLDFEAS